MISKYKKGKWTSTLLAIVLIIPVGFMGLTGCKLSTNKDSDTPAITNSSSNTKNQETNNQSNTTIKPSESSSTSANTINPAQNTVTSEDKTKEIFYGEWVIKQVLAYGPVGTYSSEDAKSLLGKSLNFSADKANYFGDQPSDIAKVATNPVYKKTAISKDDFVTNNRISLDKLGIKVDSISEITVSDSKGIVSTFLIKDDNTLIIYGGGTYFELVRKTA